eukprot:COSAG01_NODE_1746_length_9334_cov_42.941419_5_plen_588_part_00
MKAVALALAAYSGVPPPARGVGACGAVRYNDTLCRLDPAGVRMAAAGSAEACCALCATAATCSAWSFQHRWTPRTPCHLSPRAVESRAASAGDSCGEVRQPMPTPPPSPGRFVVRVGDRRQTILGLGYEIQSDSIGSNSQGLPSTVSGVPHDLVPAERARFYADMLTGFRFCRLALGLYLRGLDAAEQHIVGRWPTQMAELREMQDAAGIEGFEAEYWSPAPYWKGPNQTFNCRDGGSRVRSADSGAFTDAFANAMVEDVRYLNASGLRVSWWGLQNEPFACTHYSSVLYNATAYHTVFSAVAPKLKAAFPATRIHVSSGNGCQGAGAGVYNDAHARSFVDGWSYHHIGSDSNSELVDERARCPLGPRGRPLPAFNNEYEYFGYPPSGGATPDHCINTAQSVMNWLVFSESPKWTWLHALKPTYNAESQGFGLGFWRPPDDNSSTSGLEKGHWDYNPLNWNSLAGFVRWMPWGATRVTVDEDEVRKDQRVLAFVTPAVGSGGPHHATTPAGRLGVVLTNRNAHSAFDCAVVVAGAAGRGGPGAAAQRFRGFRYGPNITGQALGESAPVDGALRLTLPPQVIEFWLAY